MADLAELERAKLESRHGKLSSVQEAYVENLEKGMSMKDAAKLAQSKTGVSLVSGRPPIRTTRSLKNIATLKRQFS